MIPENDNILDIVLLSIFALIVIVQMIYYGTFYSYFFKNDTEDELSIQELPPVSVIVYLSYKYPFDKEHISTFLDQEYAQYQVILLKELNDVIDIEGLPKDDPDRFKILNVDYTDNFWFDKKYAYTLAVKSAKYEHLIFTKYETVPNSKLWLRLIMSKFTPNVGVVQGISSYAKKQGLKTLFFNFEFLIEIIQRVSAIKANHPYECDVPNMAIKKDVFFKIGGYKSQLQYPYGGSQKILTNDIIKNTDSKVRVCQNVNAHIFNYEDTYFKNFVMYLCRKREIRKRYTSMQRFRLRLFEGSQVLYFLLLSLGLIYISQPIYKYIVIAMILIRFLFVYSLTYKVSKVMDQKIIGLLSPLIEPLYVVFYSIVYILNKTILKTRRV